MENKQVGAVEGCVASNYPRTIYDRDEWAVFQNAYNEIRPDDAGAVGKYGFLIDYEVQNHPVRGRTIVTKENLRRGKHIWEDEWHAEFYGPSEFMRFLELLPMAYRCEILLWAYVFDGKVSVELDPASFFNHADDNKMVNIDDQAQRFIEAGEELLMDYGSFIDFDKLPWFDELRSDAWKEPDEDNIKRDTVAAYHSTEGYNLLGAPKASQPQPQPQPQPIGNNGTDKALLTEAISIVCASGDDADDAQQCSDETKDDGKKNETNTKRMKKKKKKKDTPPVYADRGYGGYGGYDTGRGYDESGHGKSGNGEDGYGKSDHIPRGGDTPSTPPTVCSLYLAPSSIPGAGLGVYSGREIPRGLSVHEHLSFCEDEDDRVPISMSTMWTDIFIPVFDSGRHAPFASWKGYVWPAYPGALWKESHEVLDAGLDVGLDTGLDTTLDEGLAFADGDVYLAEDGRRTPDGEGGEISPLSAFAPGLASLANSHPFLHNMKRDTRPFLDLGQKENHKGLLNAQATEEVMLTAPWDAGVGAFVPTFGNDFLATKYLREGTELLLDYGKGWHERQERRLQKEWGKESDGNKPDQANTTSDDLHRSPEWLADHGLCLFDGTITAGPSRIPQAGRGAFAARAIRKGTLLALSTLLAVARDDLGVAYSGGRDGGDGDQPLINYAFGHTDSSMLLVPTAPVVGYVNHSRKNPNAEIRWPRVGSEAHKLFGDPTADAGWLDRPPADVLNMSGKIALEYVALRDLRKGDEIVIDYGEGWDRSWTSFERMHPYERPGYFRREAGVPDGFYPDKWLDLSDDGRE